MYNPPFALASTIETKCSHHNAFSRENVGCETCVSDAFEPFLGVLFCLVLASLLCALKIHLLTDFADAAFEIAATSC